MADQINRKEALKMDKLISLQAAIDALMEAFCDTMIESICKDTIEALPSVQPEIVRCKDCKYKHIENMVWTCPFGLPGGELFFCAYGAERRTDDLQ